MPTITNFGDVVTQGTSTATGTLTVQGAGASAFTNPGSAVTIAGSLTVVGVQTQTGIVVPSGINVSGFGTAGTPFGNVYTSNANIYNIANIYQANVWSINVTNTSTFQNSVYHFQNTFLTGYTSTTGIIVPSSTQVSGIGGPSLLFANAYLSTANIGSSTAQMSLNVTGNVYVSNSVNVANLQAVTINASYMNVITGGYANMASINVFTGANITQLTVTTLANVSSANIVTANVQTANIVTANVQNLNVSVGANVSYLNVTYISNISNANILTANIFTANVVTANIQNLNVTSGANVSYLNVTYISNISNANILTANIFTANIVTANIQNLNVTTGANVSYLNVTYISNISNANILTANIFTANIVTANIQNLNVTTGANVSYLNVTYISNISNANILTANIFTANIVTANIQNLNVTTGANVSYLNVTYISNISNANVLTANIFTANIITSNTLNLNVSTGANITQLTVTTFANIFNSNIVTAFHANVNVSQIANIFTANVYNGNVQQNWNVWGTLSASAWAGNAAGLTNLNASNVLTGILPFRNDGVTGQGATAISINGSVGIANQFLASTGSGLQWVGPPAAIFSQVPTSVNQIFYNTGNVAIGQTNWTLFGAGYNTYPGTPLDVYGGSGTFSNVSDATATGSIRIQNTGTTWSANGGLEFKTGTNVNGSGHRIVTTEPTDYAVNGTPLIFQCRASSRAWTNVMAIQNGTAYSGYIGIGTMAPNFNLHVYQVANTTPASITLQFSNLSQSSQIYLANPSGSTVQLYLNGSNNSADGPANSATLRNNVGDLRLAAASTKPYIYLQTSSNSIGIGTQTMAASSNVTFWGDNNNKTGFPVAISLDTYLGRGNAGSLYAGDPGAAQLVITGQTNTNKRLALMYDTSNNFSLIQSMTNGTGANPLILNLAGGNVGIGTSNPQTTLHVDSSGGIGVVRSGGIWGFRIVYGNYGVSSYQDGSNFYYLITASGDQYGSYNGLRPFSFNLSSGYVTMSNGVTVNAGMTVNNGFTVNNGETINGGSTINNGLTVNNSVTTVNAGYMGYGTQNYFGGSGGTGGNGFDFEDQTSFMRMAQRNVRWYDWNGVGDFMYAQNGCIGIRTSQTSSAFETAGRVYFWGTSPSGGAQNRFTGLEADSTAASRAQVVLNSAYSDLVISSSQANGNHGSTISFTTNSTANNDYRKFVINQNNWAGDASGTGGYGDRLAFQWKDGAYTNPHSYVSPGDATLLLYGRGASVGINNIRTPGYNLHINGNDYATGGRYTSDYFRVYGANGIYWQDYGGGWYMSDTTWMRVNNDKYIYTGGQMRCAGGFSVSDGTIIVDNGRNHYGYFRFYTDVWHNDAGYGYNRFYFANGGRTYYKSPNGHEMRRNSDDAWILICNDDLTIDMRSTVRMNGQLNTQNNQIYMGSGTLSFQNNSRIYDDGQMRIYTDDYMYFYATNEFYFSTGPIHCTNDIVAYYSDDRLKTRISTIDYALDKVKSLNGFYYTHNELANSFGFKDTDIKVGVSAQEVQKVLPMAVKPAPFDHDQGVSKSGEEYLTVQYEKLVPLLIESIKELSAKVERLEKLLESK